MMNLKLPHRRQFLLLAAGAAALPLAPNVARAQAYPTRPVRIVVGFAAGGGQDILARLFGQSLSERLGQPFVVENRPGAGSNVAVEGVVNAVPDGHTLLMVGPAQAINATLYERLNFNFIRDIAPVAGLISSANVMEIHPTVPVKTVLEFIAYAKANPGKLNYASQGVGTTSHLTAEFFVSLTGTKVTHVPYRGSGPALNDILAGHVDFIFMELSSAVKLHEARKARILATATEKRLDVLPDVPTMIEAGVPGFISDTWNALSAPPKTPGPIVVKLNQAINAIVEEPDTRKRFEQLNMYPAGGSPADMRKLVEAETRRWGEVIKKAGIQPE